jgi:hypothetical protein
MSWSSTTYANADNSHTAAFGIANNGSNPGMVNPNRAPQPMAGSTGGRRRRRTVTKHRRSSKGGTRRLSCTKGHKKSHHKKSHHKKIYHKKSHHKKSHRRTRRSIRGGYAQYMNNLPTSISYSTSGTLTPSNSALANPAPINKVSNLAIDNLNHYKPNAYGMTGTGMGTPSRGWW